MTLTDCHARAEAFAARFRFVMEHPETLTAATLLDALKELEIIYESLGRVGSYAGLLYAADTANPNYQNLEQRVEQRSTEIRNLLLFFEIQWLKSEDPIVHQLMAAPALKLTVIILRVCAAFARTRSRNLKRRLSMKETIPAATPSAGFFQR